MNKIYQTELTMQTKKVTKEFFVRYMIMLLLLLAGVMTAQGQAVIMNGNYFLTHNEAGTTVNTAATTTFNPATCLWAYASRDYIRTANSSGAAINNNNNYLQYTSLSLGTDWGNWYRGGDEEYIYHRTGGTYSRRYHYPTLSNTTWGWAYNQTSQNYSTTLYDVTITSQAATATNPTINGADVLTATGNTTYTASGASYRAAYTNYYFRSANHYVDANGNTITPANATIGGYSWSISSDADVTASGTTATGTITVNTLPESDMPATITVTVTFTGGTPTVDANTTLTATKEIIIQGTKPSAPIISVSGNTATITTDAPGSTTIRYTLDGSNPTASTGTVYSGTIDLTTNGTSPINIKAVTVRNGNASDITEQSVTLTLPEPTITINGEAQTASISSSVAGATIYYTTDGTTPTTSSSQYTGTLTSLAYMTNVKAIAVKDGWNNSPVASGIVAIPSGVGGGVVTLFDYEPHSWSYYSDPDCPVRSLSPADVTITYYGDGVMMTNNNNYAAGTTDTILPGNANYKVGAKVNVGGENENTFVYYKTLERGANTDDPWTFSSGNQSSAESRCPYTTIPNPFQVRPRYGDRGSTDANNFTGWRGFQCWRLKSVSGGAVYSAASGGDALTVGAVINAETKIYFAPDNEYGMKVELEAVWARAYVKKANQANENPVGTNNVGYERNFCVPTTGAGYTLYTGNGKRITNANHIPVTISCYYPDGTAPDNTNNSISNTAFALTADTKFENIPINVTTNTLTLNNYDLIIGRGCSGTINYVRGVSGNTTAPNYTMRIESGTINYLSLLRGYWTGSNNYTDNGSTMSGNVDLRCVLGCDYDRATNEGVTNNLIINNNVILGANNTIDDVNKHRETTNLIVKSGKIGNSITINSNNSYMADAYQSIYMSVSNSQQTIGQRKVLIEGGEIIGIAGGIDAHYLGTGVTNNNVTGIPTPHTEEPSFSVRMTGGKVRGCVYGGAAKSPASGNRRMVFTGGTINGWVGCGCNGTEDDGGKTYGESFLYFGGETRCEADPSHDFTMNGTKGGYVFGAGKGYAGGTGTSGEMTYGTNVAIADNSYVQRDVFGGGNYGYALESTNVYVCGGTVHGNAFGGSNLKNGPVVNVKMIGGLIEGGLYGGSNETGNISGNVTVQIDGGQVGTPSQNANVHGGGLGNATRTLNNVYVNIGSRTDCNVSGTAVIYGDVYGGSAQGKTNGNTARQNNSVTNVTLNKGTIYGSLYGGGLGSASYAADVYGPVAVKVYGGTLTGGVYGANNVKGAPQNSVTVDIYGTDPQPGEGYAIANVYGGGNQAAYNNANYPTVTVHNNNNSIGNVYGGGNAAAVTNTKVTIFGGNRIGAVYAGGNGTGVSTTFSMVTGDAKAYICGGTIGRVFAGNNSSGIVSGTKYVRINADSSETENASNCIVGGHHDMKIGSVFQGGNQANGSPGTVKIVCTGLTTDEYIDTLFGGANNANIVNNDMSTAADVTLNIDRGHIRTGIFGGNNSGGNITGDIEINLTRNSGGTCAFPYPSVFGGGFGAGTTTGGDITLNIGEKDEASTAPTIAATIEGGAIYGGSALGSVNGSSSDKTEINIYNCTITTGNIYGGGLGESDNANKGKVNGDITVNISTEDQAAADCVTDIHTSSIYGCNNTGGSPQGNVTVHVWKTGLTTGNYSSASTGTLYAIDQVFGGGNAADYAPAGDNKATVYIHDCINSIRRVFGGGNAAAAKGVVTTIDGGRYDYIFGGGNGEGEGNPGADIGSGGTNLTVNAGRINHLFGGSNERGSITGPMRTNVNYSKMGTSGCDELIIEFFGGGNLAEIGTSEHPVNLSTTIACNTVFTAVYGGSNLADIYGDVTLTINGGTIGEAYGGSKGRLADNSDPEHPITAKAANIHGNVTLNIYGGAIGNAFGGSNINGNITDTIGVILDWQGDCPGKSINYIYGGSNQAAYTPDDATDITPTVKLINGTVNNNVYGGGKGSSATVTANPKVIAGDGTTPTNSANVQGDIFGGGDAANVTGKTNVRVVHNSKVGGNVFGGGNQAAISQDTEVEIKDQARIGGNVYGGGNQGAIGGNTKVIVNSSK